MRIEMVEMADGTRYDFLPSEESTRAWLDKHVFGKYTEKEGDK